MIGIKETKINNSFQCPCKLSTTTNVSYKLEDVPKQKCLCRNLPTFEESKTKIECHPKMVQEIKSNLTISNRCESVKTNDRCCTVNINGLREIVPKINKIKCSCDDYKSDAHMLKVIYKLIYNELSWKFTNYYTGRIKIIHVSMDFALNVSVEYQIYREVMYHRQSIHRVKHYHQNLLQNIVM